MKEVLERMEGWMKRQREKWRDGGRKRWRNGDMEAEAGVWTKS